MLAGLAQHFLSVLPNSKTEGMLGQGTNLLVYGIDPTNQRLGHFDPIYV